MQDVTKYRVVNAIAVQNYGRSGSTFVQSLLDGHPNILSTPNFYSRAFYEKWQEKIADVPDEEKQKAFIGAFRQWFDTAYVDHSAGLHRLGPAQNQIAHVDEKRFERLLAAFFKHNEMTRRNLFIGTHLAYGLCLDRDLAQDLWILYPIHGPPKKVADALLEDFPETKFLYTVREPLSNFASSLSHYRTSNMDYASHPVVATLGLQFCRLGHLVKEAYIDRPYREIHREIDQAKAIRLEDLHAQPENVMSSVVTWLGLPWHDCLLDSTFDGKIWWNRPESPKQHGFGGQMLSRNVVRRLSPLDRFRVSTIARPKARMWGYEPLEETRTARLGRAALFFLTLWMPWREELRTGASPYRVVQILAGVRRFLPASLRIEIDERLTREKRRNAYLAFDNGVRGIRARRPDSDKSEWVQCMIVLYPDPERDGYKGRIYEDLPVSDSERHGDRAIVRFIDELTDRSDRRSAPSAVSVLLGLSRTALHIRSYLSVRWWSARAYLQVRRDHGEEVGLLRITDHGSADARDTALPKKTEAALSAA